MSYDCDIVVIGAGPAGLSAAIRARWLKTSNALPASVALLDPAGYGGIAAMGMIYLTGPSLGLPGRQLIESLKNDVDKMEIPLFREAAVEIGRDGDCWQIRTERHTLRCLAVVLATGLRRLSHEAELMEANRLTHLSGGYTRAADRFKEWSDLHTGSRLVMIGGEPLSETFAEFVHYDNGKNTIRALCEPRQRVLACELDGRTVVLTVEEAQRRETLACDLLMIDYHSLELAPPSLAFLPDALKTPVGYSLAGPAGVPSAPGLFACGDCAGQPSLCVKALAQGSEAGFNAYRYVYRYKFGCAPHLFAFYVSPERPSLDTPELPEIDPAIHIPVGLTSQSHFPAPLPMQLFPDAREKLSGLSSMDIDTLHKEIGEKIATVHRRIT